MQPRKSTPAGTAVIRPENAVNRAQNAERRSRRVVPTKVSFILMATNIEIKARIEDMEALRARAARLSDTPVETLFQDDTFFVVPKGRLKLRVLAPDRGELIYYERADSLGPKPSDYFITTTADPQTLRTVLAAALGIRGTVRKRRWLYIAGHTRIHLDQVDGLGAFMELEVVLDSGQTAADGTATALQLMQDLKIDERHLVKGAYIDLLTGAFSAVGSSGPGQR